MAATNVFYRLPSQRSTRVISIPGNSCTLDQFFDHIIKREGLSRDDFIVAYGTKVFRSDSCNLQAVCLQNNSNVDILIPLLGGKGGFGSLLRAIGAQIEKTTNRDACRDLSGRRLRDIKREDELRKLIALRDKLEDERKRRKKEKLERLKKKTEEISSNTKSIQELVQMFEDNEYNKRRLQIADIIDAAVEKGILNFKKRQLGNLSEKEDSERVKKAKCESHDRTNSQEADRRRSESPTNKLETATTEEDKDGKSLNLWLGLEEDLS